MLYFLSKTPNFSLVDRKNMIEREDPTKMDQLSSSNSSLVDRKNMIEREDSTKMDQLSSSMRLLISHISHQ